MSIERNASHLCARLPTSSRMYAHRPRRRVAATPTRSSEIFTPYIRTTDPRILASVSLSRPRDYHSNLSRRRGRRYGIGLTRWRALTAEQNAIGHTRRPVISITAPDFSLALSRVLHVRHTCRRSGPSYPIFRLLSSRTEPRESALPPREKSVGALLRGYSRREKRAHPPTRVVAPRFPPSFHSRLPRVRELTIQYFQKPISR